jgi:hypothetical protein
MGETLKQRFGPLPVWAWALIFVVLLGAFLAYRKNKAAAAAAAAQQQSSQGLSSNLGTVPVSNLTTTAQPMPIQMGDTFVSTSIPQSVNVSPSTTVNNQLPSYTMQTAPPPAPSPVVSHPVAASPPPQTQQGYGAGLQQLLGLNPNLLKSNIPPAQGGVNVPGITGYQVSYNGIPL